MSNAVEVRGDYAYTAITPFLVLLSVKNPEFPELIDTVQVSYTTHEIPYEIAVFDNPHDQGKVVHVYNQRHYARIVSVSYFYDMNIARIDSLYPGSLAPAYIREDSLLYLATGYFLRIFNIVDPLYPKLVSTTNTFALSGIPRHYIAKYKHYIFKAASDFPEIIDVSDPRQPALFTDAYNLGYQIAFKDDYLYSVFSPIVYINDFSDMTNPVSVTSFPNTNSATGIHIEDGYAYLYRGDGFDAYDLSDPLQPRLAASYNDFLGYIQDIDVEGNLVFLSTIHKGLVIVRNDAIVSAGNPPAAESAALLSSYPNPFSGVTNIAYSLPATQHLELTITDALGRTVAVLHSGMQESGRHIATFNAGALPPGTYRCAMRTTNGMRSMPLALVR